MGALGPHHCLSLGRHADRRTAGRLGGVRTRPGHPRPFIASSIPWGVPPPWRVCPRRRTLAQREVAAVSDEPTIPNEMQVVRDALRSLGYANAYDVPVSPWLCEEPIVVSMTDW